MRTTLDIDDDVLTIVKDIARAQRKTAGAVISELTRQALKGTQTTNPTGSDFAVKDGWVVWPSRGGVVTKEQVDQIMADLDGEDVERAIALGRQRPDLSDD